MQMNYSQANAMATYTGLHAYSMLMPMQICQSWPNIQNHPSQLTEMRFIFWLSFFFDISDTINFRVLKLLA